VHAYPHLAAGDLGLADVPELERIRRAVAVLDDRFHTLFLAEVRARVCSTARMLVAVQA
jgi:hypothetical protein